MNFFLWQGDWDGRGFVPLGIAFVYYNDIKNLVVTREQI